MSEKYENIPPLLQDWADKLRDPNVSIYVKENYRNMFSFIRDFADEQIKYYAIEKANKSPVKAYKK